MPCYCGCDTKANRIKFALSGLLFAIGWVCLFFIVGLDNCNTGTYNRACNNESIDDGEGGLSLNPEAQSPADQAAFEACAVAKLEYETCMNRIMPGTVFLTFLWLVCWLGSIVPLCMLCCCTQNPHQYAGTAPIHLQMTQMPPPRSVYAPSNPYQDPFLQGAQEQVLDSNSGLRYGGQKYLEDDIPIYTAQVIAQAPPQEGKSHTDAK